MTGIKMHDDDAVEHIIYTSTHDYLLFFTNTGRVYKMKGYKVPVFGRTSKGLPLINVLPLEKEERLQAVTTIKDFDTDEFLFFVTKGGTVKRTATSDYQNIRSSGIRAINLKDGDELLDVKLTDGSSDIILGSSNGKAIRFNEQDARQMGRTAAGVRGMTIGDKDTIIGSALVDDEHSEVLIVTEKGYGKRTDVNEYRTQNRGGKGVKTLNVTEKNGALVRLSSVSGEEDLIILSNLGTMIRIPIEQITRSSRATQGVRLIRLNEGHYVATTAVVPKNGEEDDLQNEDTQPSLSEEAPVGETDAVDPSDTTENSSESDDASETDEPDEETDDDNEEEKPQLTLFNGEEE